MNSKPYFLLLFTMVGLASCQSDPDTQPSGVGSGSNLINDGTWSIPIDQVHDGGPGKDGIPALESPLLIQASNANFLADFDLIVGYKSGDEIRAYPHQILDWHEIINDRTENENFAITYCPLTGTAIGWNRDLQNNTTTFGVSGLLYNTNLIPYDRYSGSNWSQIGLECVNGGLKGEKVDVIQVVETTWGNWKNMYPDTKVVSLNTGHSRNYGTYPYGDYKTNHTFFLFPVSPKDDRIASKKRVLGVINNNSVKVYKFDNFSGGVSSFYDQFDGEEIILAGSNIRNFMVAFYPFTEDGERLQLSAVSDNSSIIFEDENDNQWNIFGEAVNGPLAGSKLKQPVSFIAYWFSWSAFYDNVEIFEPL